MVKSEQIWSLIVKKHSIVQVKHVYMAPELDPGV